MCAAHVHMWLQTVDTTARSTPSPESGEGVPGEGSLGAEEEEEVGLVMGFGNRVVRVDT